MASTKPTVMLLALLVVMMRPKLIVESGTFHGSATLIMAAAAKENDIAVRIHTADPVKHNKAYELAEAYEFMDMITFWECDFLDMLKEVDGTIDLAYIDGGVRLPQVEAVLPRLAQDGLIVVDDTKLPCTFQGGMKIREMASINLPYERGISIIESHEHL